MLEKNHAWLPTKHHLICIFQDILGYYIMDLKYWWVLCGSSTPTLQHLALKLFDQPCSSSCCESNWSTYSFTHSLKRNKTTSESMEDSVYVYTSLCLLSRSTQLYNARERKMSDHGGEGFKSFKDPVILKVANVSIDKPDLEVV